jgi:hypothetical protein
MLAMGCNWTLRGRVAVWCAVVLPLASLGCTTLLGVEDPIEVGTDAGSFDAGVDALADGDADATSALELSVEPSSYIFTPTVSGGSDFGPPLDVTVRNEGETTTPPLQALLYGDSGDTSAFGIVGDTCTEPLAVGAACTVSVRAQPSAVGTFAARLGVGAATPNAFVSLSVSVQTSLYVNPPLGTLGSESDQAIFNVVNEGDFDAPNLDVTGVDPPLIIDAASTCLLNMMPRPVLARGDSCVIIIDYDGAFLSPTASVTFQITSNGTPLTSAGLFLPAGTSPNSGRPDAAPSSPPPAGPPLPVLYGGGLGVAGVTSDGEIIVVGEGSTRAVPLPAFPSDEGVVTLTSDPGLVATSGTVAFVWQEAPSAAPMPAPLTVWQAGMAPQNVSDAAQPYVSASFGSQVYFAEPTATDASAGSFDLVEAPIADPSQMQVAIGGITLGGNAGLCNPVFRPTAAGLFVGACTGQGPSDTTVTLFDTSGVATLIAAGVGPGWDVDTSGDRVFVALGDGTGEVLDPTGNLVSTVDTGVTGGVLDADGQSATYAAGGALKRSSVLSPAPTTLVPSGAAGVWATNATAAIFYGSVASGGFGSLQVVPLTGGTPSPLAVGVGLPVGFTTDGSYVLWTETASAALPDLFAAPVPTASGGSLPTQKLSSGGVAEVVLGPGATVIYADQVVGSSRFEIEESGFPPSGF